MSDGSPPNAKKRFPWLKALLFVSLALNLLVVGLVAGALLGKGPAGDGSRVLRSLGQGPFVEALPRKDKRAIADAYKARARSFGDNRRELRRAFEDVLRILRADPLDEAALRRAIEGQRDRVSERITLGADLLIERVAQMSASERAAYADRLDASLRSRGPGKPGTRDKARGQ